MEQLDEILQLATAFIGPEYFLLPIHGADPIHRERVYCYELYHQMRLRWPRPEACPYRLNGEIDNAPRVTDRAARRPSVFQEPARQTEAGSPRARAGSRRQCAASNPSSGASRRNKPSRAQTREIRKDFATLCRFGNLGYQRAIYLIYGVEAVLDRIHRSAGDLAVPIEVWFHPAAGAPATPAFTLTPVRL